MTKSKVALGLGVIGLILSVAIGGIAAANAETPVEAASAPSTPPNPWVTEKVDMALDRGTPMSETHPAPVEASSGPYLDALLKLSEKVVGPDATPVRAVEYPSLKAASASFLQDGVLTTVTTQALSVPISLGTLKALGENVTDRARATGTVQLLFHGRSGRVQTSLITQQGEMVTVTMEAGEGNGGLPTLDDFGQTIADELD